MKVLIKKFKKTDQLKLQEFCQSIYREMDWDWNYVKDLDDIENNYKKGYFFIVKDEKGIIACGGLQEITGGEILLKRLYVDKFYRGKGVAKNILNKMEQLVGNKYKYLVADVLKNNIRSIKFFTKNGFDKFKPPVSDDWSETKSPEVFDFYRKILPV